MRRLGDQGDAFAGHAIGHLAHDRPDGAARDQREGTEKAAGAGHHRGLELRDGQGGEGLRRGSVFHPDDRGAGQAVAVGQGHQRERPAGAVDFGRDVVMRHGMRHSKCQRLLAVAGGGHADPGGVPHRRGATVGGDDQPGADAGAVAEADQRLALAGQQGLRGGAGAVVDGRQVRQPRHHLAPQQPVRKVPAERAGRDLRGIEIAGQAGLGFRSARIDNAHDPERCGMRGEAGPEAGVLKQGAGGLQEGGGAQVCALGRRVGHGRGGIAEQDRQAHAAEQGRRGQPGDAAAGDQDVCVGAHVPSAANR